MMLFLPCCGEGYFAVASLDMLIRDFQNSKVWQLFPDFGQKRGNFLSNAKFVNPQIRLICFKKCSYSYFMWTDDVHMLTAFFWRMEWMTSAVVSLQHNVKWLCFYCIFPSHY